MLVHPRQREGLRVLKICYEEHIINSVVCRGGTTSIDVRRLKTRGYIIQRSMTLKKSVTRTNSHAES